MKGVISFIFLSWILINLSCKKESSCESCGSNSNRPPIAMAGPDQVITLPTDSASLDGSASNDPDGTISVWLWKKISGPASFNIISAIAGKTVVNSLVAGTYKFELKVTDDKGLSAKDTIQVIVDAVPTANHPPVANAGADQTITLPANTITLDGSVSTDPENNIASYIWSKISGPSLFNISNANEVQTQVANLVEGVYQFELKVTDAGGLFSKDTVQASVNGAAISNNCDIGTRPSIKAQLIQIGTLSEARNPVVAAAGSKIVFAGGLNNWICGPDYGIASSAIDIYDINTHTWAIAQLSIPRWGIAAVACGNKIFFAGGENGQWTSYDNVDIYDVSTNTWTVAHLSEPRGFLSAATIGNKVFFAGGYNYPNNSGPITLSSKVDIYDLSTNQWSTENLSAPKSNLGATSAGNKIYFTAAPFISNSIDIYNDSTNSWTISTLRYLHSATAGVAVGDNIYWAGEVSAGQGYAGKVEIKNIVNGTTTIDCLSDIRFKAVLKNDDIVFLSAGNDFDIYNTIAGKWSIGRLDQLIFTADAAVISVNNTIYVGGGVVGGCGLFSDKVCILSW